MYNIENEIFSECITVIRNLLNQKELEINIQLLEIGKHSGDEL